MPRVALTGDRPESPATSGTLPPRLGARDLVGIAVDDAAVERRSDSLCCRTRVFLCSGTGRGRERHGKERINSQTEVFPKRHVRDIPQSSCYQLHRPAPFGLEGLLLKCGARPNQPGKTTEQLVRAGGEPEQGGFGQRVRPSGSGISRRALSRLRTRRATRPRGRTDTSLRPVVPHALESLEDSALLVVVTP
jgi:hypothetical protein